MATIAQIEDKIILTLTNLGSFKAVYSVGRDELPPTLAYPFSSVYFTGMKDAGVRPRPVHGEIYEVLVGTKNVKSEKDASSDVYALIEAVDTALSGKVLAFTDIEPLWYISAEIVSYKDGQIIYAMQFQTKHNRPVPTPDY